MSNYELVHWGTKGMRWGVRRYQNRDGTLTNAGKKRYNKELEKLREEARTIKNKKATEAKIDRLNTLKNKIDNEKNKNTNEPNQESTKRSVRDMSDEELKSIVTRLQFEQRYRELNPKQVSAGKKFATDMLNKAVIPAIQEVSKNAIKSMLESAVNASTKDKK